MRSWVPHVILVAAALVALTILVAHATDPILYSAENISAPAHADPATIEKRSLGDATAVIPLMDELLGCTGTLALTIKVKDYESAERDLARYSELTGQFSNLVVKLDLSETDIGEFQRKSRENQDSLTALLADSQRFDELQRLEIEMEGDEGQRMAVAYEGEALRQKMQKTFSTYAGRESAVSGIAQRYNVDSTSYKESVDDLAGVVDAAEGWDAGRLSPLSIIIDPAEGYYGDEIWIVGTYADAPPGTPVEIYIDSRSLGVIPLDDKGWYAYPYQIDSILTGPHAVYATIGDVYSEVGTLVAHPENTTLSLTPAISNRTIVTCTGKLTADGRSVTCAPITIRVDDTKLFQAETNWNGVYEKEIALPPGEHTVKAEFHGAGFPLNPSESRVWKARIRDELPSPIPIVGGIAALLGSVWYLGRRYQIWDRSRHTPRERVFGRRPPRIEEILKPRAKVHEISPIDIEILSPQHAATHLFYIFRAKLGIPETKTPRDCARLAPDHARFFEYYERVRYAGVIPTDEDLQWMEDVARGDDR